MILSSSLAAALAACSDGTYQLGDVTVMCGDSESRVVYAMLAPGDSGDGQRPQVICAEPSPDVAKAVSQACQLDTGLEMLTGRPESRRHGATIGATIDATTAPMKDDDGDGEWLTIAEAARRLGVKPDAIRSRIQRKTLRVRPGKQANDGLVRVWITAPTTVPTVALTAEPTVAPTADHVAELLAEIAMLRERIGRHEGAEAELRARLADQAAELAEGRRHGRDMVGRLDQLHRDRLADAERHRAEIEALRAELARPWWRRRRR